MKSNRSVVALALFALTLAAAPAPAQEQDKPAKYAVVQVDGEYRVVPADGVDQLKDDLKREHKEAVEAHKAAKKEAQKNKEKFSEPAPKAKKLKVVKPSLDKEAADALVAELREKGQKKGGADRKPAKKPAKKAGKGKSGKSGG